MGSLVSELKDLVLELRSVAGSEGFQMDLDFASVDDFTSKVLIC
jgi:hypothetical protein